MSYILDALNKSEKERASKRLRHLPPDDTSRESSTGTTVFPVAVATILVLAAATAGYYLTMTPDEALPPPASEIAETTSAPATRTAPEPPVMPDIVFQPGPAVDINDLPGVIRKVLPDVEITSHIYAADPTLRMVKINGVSRHEGNELGQQHRLVRITESGVILDFQGYRYRLDVVEDWQKLESD